MKLNRSRNELMLKNREKRSMFKFSVLSLALALLMSCTTDVTISMDDRPTPTFKFKRNFSEVNTLPFFAVMEIASENRSLPYSEQSFDKNVTLWRIVPQVNDTPIDNLPSITYGRIPPGFVQEIPTDGQPPALV